MLQVGAYVFKRATTAAEFEQIHALNHRTFVTEIPQHAATNDERLVDKFHHKNAYLIAVRDGEVLGMVSVHSQAPFSVAPRLPDPGLLSAPGVRPMEVRLLAIDPDKRNGMVFGGLVWLVYQYAVAHNRTHLFISGFEDRVTLYKQLGFEPIGTAVRSGAASFVPMMVTVPELERRHRRGFELWTNRQSRTRQQAQTSVCLLPGPVTIAPAVHSAFHRLPIYHRGADFIELHEEVRGTLARMTGARGVALFNGSGTLGNEVVAATLSAEPRPTHGLILVNGEFGQRLADQAARFGLSFNTLKWNWGEPWQLDEIDNCLRGAGPRVDWVWGVHQESSTGVLNPLAELVKLGKQHEVRVCVDCISSLGATPLDLSDVYLATGSTGKALGSFAGAALVFADAARLKHLDTRRVPGYFDLPATLATVGPRYTFPSPTLSALDVALREYETPEKAHACYERYRLLGSFVRRRLRSCGIEPLARESWAAPVVTTFSPPHEESAEAFVARCHFWGFAVGGQSGYLAQRRLVQIATMGAITEAEVAPLFNSAAFPECVVPTA